MLTHLSVHNYALIDQLEVDFSKGLSIITGETGAGKSILLGALGLVSGNRADTQSLQDKSKKCVIEAQFDIAAYPLKSFFEEQELDYEKLTTIRREINPEGKSRAFINDTPVTLSQLKELTEQLIDIHSQHQTLTLNGSSFQTSVVDAFAGNNEKVSHYEQSYKQYRDLEKELTLLVNKELQAKKDLDYLQFQFNELNEMDFKSGEQESAEQELEALNHAEEIKSNLNRASIALNGMEDNLLNRLAEVKTILGHFAKYKPEIRELSDRINSSYIELKDIGNELESAEQDVLFDPQRIELLNARLDTLYRLQQKHQVNSVEGLLNLKEEINEKLLDYNSMEHHIEQLNKQLKSAGEQLTKLANELSANRKKAIPSIEKEIASLLTQLSMPNARLKIELETSKEFGPTGFDRIHFLFSANKGSEFKELSKVASGGELSRLMLSVKSLISKLLALPTIIFDEIDTGVSGDVADKVGGIMNQMAQSMQVITITHLPQIASKGNNHLFVYKEDKGNKTFSNIRKLTAQERVQEIAKMLSTGNPSEAAINNAKELLKN